MNEGKKISVLMGNEVKKCVDIAIMQENINDFFFVW